MRAAARYILATLLSLALAACDSSGSSNHSQTGQETGSDSTSQSFGPAPAQNSSQGTEKDRNSTAPTPPRHTSNNDRPAQPPAPEEDDGATVSLSWSIPTTRENGDPLSIAELGGYQIVYFREGDDPQADCCVVDVDDPQTTEFQLDIAQSGTWYFAISAYDSNLIYSALSDPVSAVF